ncbi:hypothetical protein PRUPE_4G226300 [Prunus persica]|uniref:Uncharacterized protein n=1 Tax=Prunus persica TaxID=3760 RepID=A0A251PR04_PRUPE|nr:hypothetical protein PRUPE_4G226300 [Prunus persica]
MHIACLMQTSPKNPKIISCELEEITKRRGAESQTSPKNPKFVTQSQDKLRKICCTIPKFYKQASSIIFLRKFLYNPTEITFSTQVENINCKPRE